MSPSERPKRSSNQAAVLSMRTVLCATPAAMSLKRTLPRLPATYGMACGRSFRKKWQNETSIPQWGGRTWRWMLRLKRVSPAKLVRLLNTSNGGLNDFTTTDFTVRLLDENHHVLKQIDGTFGKIADDAFQAAFARPEFFNQYADVFQSMLSPGVRVRFGDGWKEITFGGPAAGVRSVRVNINHFWALGGGLNGVQIY